MKGNRRNRPMTHNVLSAPTDACSPDADRAGPAVPENIARILYVVRILLGFGRHLAATIERRAAGEGIWLFRAVFGTDRLPVILAYIHRAILRATALETLLLMRAAAGHDVAPALLDTGAAASAAAGPGEDPFSAQVARLAAERAQHDAPIDPANLATAEQIEAEVLARPIGRTINDIRRDLGLVAIMCTPGFWGAATSAIACYGASAALWREDSQPTPACSPPAAENGPKTQHKPQGPGTRHRRRAGHAPHVIARSEATKQPRSQEPPPCAPPEQQNCSALARLAIILCCASLLPGTGLNHQCGPGSERRKRTRDSRRDQLVLAQPRHIVTVPCRRAAGAATATGPPLRAAMNRAA